MGCGSRAKLRVKFMHWNTESARSGNQPLVKAHQGDRLSAGAEEFDRRQMQGVECPHGDRKRLQGAGDDWRRQFDQRHMADQGSRRLAMRWPKAPRVDAVPDLIFEEAAGNHGFAPDRFGRRAILCQQMCESDRTVEIDHWSSRSCCNSFSRSRNAMIGLHGGGLRPASTGGVSQPARTASANSASARSWLRPACGGTISATTRSRSVTSTVSPPAARRIYSLSLFLSTLRPTERISRFVASRSYFCQLRK